jgi:hypothetical protein
VESLLRAIITGADFRRQIHRCGARRWSLPLLLLLAVPGTVPAQYITNTIVQDDFAGLAGALPDGSRFVWGGDVAQNGSGQLNLTTDSANQSWLRSLNGAAPGPGQTLVLQLRAYAYAEDWNPGVYGDQQPRGLRVGTDANNAAEFYSLSKTSVGLRVRKDGAESLGTFAVPSGVDSMHDYEISVTTTSVCFKVDGADAGTFTSNIPTGPLNVHVSTSDGGAGNVPVTIENLSLALVDAAPIYVVRLEDFTWMTNNGAITITRYTGTNGAVAVPDTITDLPVTAIGMNAFYSCTSLTNLLIGNSVTEIGNGAFSGCTSLAGVTIGRGVTNLGYHVFFSCPSLTAINVDPLNSAFVSVNGILFDKSQTALIQCPGGRAGSYTIPAGVASIGAGAFDHCAGLTGVTMPNSVTNIEDGAFYSCTGLTNLTLGNGVTRIGNLAFYSCTRLTNAIIPDSVTIISGAFSDCTGLAGVTLGNSVADISGAFVRCSSLAGVTIPASVSSIGDMAFAGCSSLASVSIPNSVTNIFGSAFSACASLTNLTIPDSVTSIGNYAFHYCTGLAAVTLGNHLVTIGDNAFNNCSGLINVTIPDSVNTIGNSAFFYCTSLGTATLGRNVTSIGGSAFVYCHSLASITIPNSVTSIGSYAFNYCTSLSSVTLGTNVTSIGGSAFASCHSLTSVTIPASVTSIGDEAFLFCKSLTNLTVDASNAYYSGLDGVLFDKNRTTLIQYPGGKAGAYRIPGGVTRIGFSAFHGCTGLTGVTIPNSVTRIDTYAFYGCTGLTTLTIPGSVTSIGDYVFVSCSGLTGVYFQGDPPGVGSSIFYSDNGATAYYLPRTSGWEETFAGLSTVLWNPQFQVGDAGFGVQANCFSFNITGSTNIPIVLEACTNLARPTWVTLESCTLTNGSLYFSDPDWTNSRSRFYRVRSP